MHKVSSVTPFEWVGSLACARDDKMGVHRACGSQMISRVNPVSRESNHLRRASREPISTLATTGRFRSGQTGQTVNLLAYAFAGSNPALPSLSSLIVNETWRRRFAATVGRIPLPATHLDLGTLELGSGGETQTEITGSPDLQRLKRITRTSFTLSCPYQAAVPAAEPSNGTDDPILVIVPSLFTTNSSITEETKPALSRT